MDLALQLGHGMMTMSEALVSSWGGGTVILSPRDLDDSQLHRMSARIQDDANGEVLLDPQFYLPHADHHRLVQHGYWPQAYETNGFWGGEAVGKFVASLLALNDALGCQEFIVPSLFAEQVDEDWATRQRLTMAEARRVNAPERLLATVALGADALRSSDQVHAVLDEARGWDVGGVYLVPEHPNGDYLVKDPAWLANLLDLVAGLRLRGLRVVVGYSNQQMLILAAAGATTIASGTWMNVRCFPPEKFRTVYDDEMKQRATWFYSPQALSEYKLATLDIAQRLGMLEVLRPDRLMGAGSADILFAGPQPSTVGFREPDAFRHFLTCLKWQTERARKDSFDSTLDEHMRLMDNVETLLARLHAEHITGQLRDFYESIDAHRQALTVLRQERGPTLRRKWAELAS